MVRMAKLLLAASLETPLVFGFTDFMLIWVLGRFLMQKLGVSFLVLSLPLSAVSLISLLSQILLS